MGEAFYVQGSRFESTGYHVVPHAAVANVKGAYKELLAATTFDWKGFAFIVNNNFVGVAHISSLTDLAIGAAGSEIDLLPNMPSAGMLFTLGYLLPNIAQYIPVAIPKGTRISARGQNGTGGTEINSYMTVLGFDGGFSVTPPIGRVVNYGSLPATSRGTVATSGALSDQKGAWVQLSASVTSPIRYLIPMGTRVSGRACVDIGVGGAGLEVVIIPDMFHTVNGAHMIRVFPVAIPAGVRLAVRHSFNGSVNQPIDIAVLAIS